MNKCYSLELRPNRSLLDPSFEGYKLSLEPILLCEHSIETGVYVVQPSDIQFSFLHIKSFALNNHLHSNPYKPENIYFVDKNLEIYKIIFSSTEFNVKLEKVFKITNIDFQSNKNYNISVVFLSLELVVVNNGSGSIYFLKIIEQQNSENWEILDVILEDNSNFLKDARVEVLNDNQRTLHILLLCITEKNENEKKNLKVGLFKSILIWKALSISKNKTLVEVFCKKLSIDGYVEYVALEPGCKSIYIISEKTPQWIFDFEESVQCYKHEKNSGSLNSPKLYSWSQNNEEIVFWLPLLTEITKNDLKILIEDYKLEVKVKDKPLIAGNFYHKVEKNLSFWSFEKNMVELHLYKSENSIIWENLLCDDDKGEQIFDVDNIKESFKNKVLMQSDEDKVFSNLCMQQLEECDDISSESISLVRIEASSHLITHKISLSSYQWLFDVRCDPVQAPAICCRLDVDACIWQFKEINDKNQDVWPHEHLGTFYAFGYVQASKSQKKFLTCPPTLTYAVVCDGSHHIYIYRHPLPLKSELKNRQTGQKIKTISKQQLINLGTNEQILGIIASDNFLFILLESKIFVAALNT